MSGVEEHSRHAPRPTDALRGGLTPSELLDATMDSILVYKLPADTEPSVIYANRSAADSRGYRAGEMVGLRLSQIVAPGEYRSVLEELSRLGEQRHLTYETVHVRKDGTSFPVEVRAALFGTEDEKVAVVVVRDISESMRLRSELDGALQRALADRSQLRTMMDSVPVGMALVGPQGEVLEVNHANEEIWRTEEHPMPPELGGYTVFRGWDPETGQPMQPTDWPVADVMETGQPVYDRIVEIERFDGSRGIVEISAIPVKDRAGGVQSMVVLTIDVTDREMRERLSSALDELNLEIHATLEGDRILERVLTRAVRILEADFGMVVRLSAGACALERYAKVPEGLDLHVPYADCRHAAIAVQSGRPLFVEDVAVSSQVADEARAAGLGAMMVVPLALPGEEGLVLELSYVRPRTFGHSERDFATKVGEFAAFALDNARLYGELAKSLDAVAEKDAAIRQAYSDVIEAVTGGRLIILDRDELADEMLPDAEPRRLIDAPSQLAEARRNVKARLDHAEMTDDMMLAFGEALNNALKYAGEACYAVNADDTRVQIVVSDTGPGIDFGHLPKATLVSGYSTEHTLGVGFTLMMELTDRVLLCTGREGTTVVLEREFSSGISRARIPA